MPSTQAGHLKLYQKEFHMTITVSKIRTIHREAAPYPLVFVVIIAYLQWLNRDWTSNYQTNDDPQAKREQEQAGEFMAVYLGD